MSGSGKGSRASSGSTKRANGTRGQATSRSAADRAARTSTEVAVPEPAIAASRRTRGRINRRSLFIGFGVFAILVIGSIALYTWWNVNKSLAQIDGTARLDGLKANVEVTRDTNGVPHILADSAEDLYAAQGYVHAQDRLYQMFFFRTLGRGRLAELFQPGLANADKFLRTLGFARVAQAELGQLGPQARAGLEAYARGVNSFVNTHRDSLPVEFGLLGVGFEDWTPVDSLIFGKVQALDLTDTWANELLTSDMTGALGNEVVGKLLPGYPANAPVTVPQASGRKYGADVEAFLSVLRPLKGGWGEGYGSNNWAVAGRKSATGKPLLANDPHLGVRNPSIWYEIQLSTRDGSYDAAGFGFAGAPGIVTGHNKNIAWGVTNLSADVMDVFLEQLDPAQHAGQYRSPAGWKPLNVYTETIKVRDAEPVTHTVRVTDHGPIISDAIPISPAISTFVTGTYSIQWTALEPGTLFESVYELQTASSWEEFRSALSKWDVPGQNFVYADAQGNIGYQAAGRVPVRSSDGTVPSQGWTSAGDWKGFVPFEQMPTLYNPAEGFVATANNRPYAEGAAAEFPGYWAQPWRIERIREVLAGKDSLSLDDLQALQLDTRSGLARQVTPFLTAVQPEDARALQATGRLKGWDGNMAVDSVPATVFEVAFNSVISRTLGDEMGSDLFLQYLDTRPGEALRAVSDLLDKPQDPLWDRKDTGDKVETRDDILSDSLTSATGQLTGFLGDNMDEWAWGKIHQITPRHEFSDATLVGGMFQLQAQPIGGDMTTVSVAGYPLVAAAFPLQQAYPVTTHQSYRMLLDTADWSRSRAIFLTGASGQPGSPYRENMYPLWTRGEYLPMPFTSEQVAAAKKAVLTLTP